MKSTRLLSRQLKLATMFGLGTTEEPLIQMGRPPREWLRMNTMITAFTSLASMTLQLRLTLSWRRQSNKSWVILVIHRGHLKCSQLCPKATEISRISFTISSRCVQLLTSVGLKTQWLFMALKTTTLSTRWYMICALLGLPAQAMSLQVFIMPFAKLFLATSSISSSRIYSVRTLHTTEMTEPL